MMTPDEFHAKIMLWCAYFEGSVTSYGRTRDHNLAVGGVIGSAHPWWLAADIVYDTTPPHGERAMFAARHGLLLIVEDDHDHLQPVDWRA